MPKYGSDIQMNVYGSSHGEKIGVQISGLPCGVKIDLDKLQNHVDRRKASSSTFSTQRIEPDRVVCERGIDEKGFVCADSVEFSVYNTTAKSSDYADLKYKPRPSHADYPAYVKYGLEVDLSGGGKYSGRLTLPLCIAGGIAEQLLAEKGVFVCSYISSIAGIDGKSYKDAILTLDELEQAKKDPFFFLKDKKEQVEAKLKEAKDNLDSLGGIIETVIYGLPIGIGDSLFDGAESAISSAVFSVPAVKGVEFGLGFDFAYTTGSKSNDAYYYDGNRVKTLTNNNGGIVGGMTNGSPVTFRTVIKPTPSIGIEQKTVDLKNKSNTTIQIKGRHDVCITPRAVAPVESVTAFALLDLMTKEK